MAKTWYRLNALTDGCVDRVEGDDHSTLSEDLLFRDVPSRPPQTGATNGLVRASKSTSTYNAHSYPTKVPPEAIVPFLAHFTRPGDTVLDPFCGSGMTGVASSRTGRRAILNDLSPLAVHLAYNHTTPCDPKALLAEWVRIREALRFEERRHYHVRCDNCRKRGLLRYTIWSDVYRCPECASCVNLWDSATAEERGSGTKVLSCSRCACCWRKSASTRVRSEPTWVAYACSCSPALRFRALSPRERTKAAAFTAPAKHHFVPRQRIDPTREMYQRSALHLRGIRIVADFYTPRNLSALATLWHAIRSVRDERVRIALAFAFTNTAWHGTRMRRYNARGGQRPLTGTLYIPQLSSEANVFDVFDHKVRHLARFYRDVGRQATTSVRQIKLGSATALEWVPDASIDYVFTDPPFGANIFYADCNLIAEAWLGVLTDAEKEAVVNRSRVRAQGGKTITDYEAILEAAFKEMHRVLRPGRWATVVFQSSDGAVWKAIEAAADQAGLSVQSADILDKGQQSMKGYKGRGGAEHVASFDIVLHLRKPALTATRQLRLRAVDAASQGRLALKTVEKHLRGIAPDNTSARTLPFLYSLCVRALLNAGRSVNGFSMELLRSTLSTARHVERDGCWHLGRRDSVLNDTPLSRSAVGS